MTPVIFGEVLFDCFDSGERVLGGAPFNVAWHLAGFGATPLLVSAVGYDDDGQAILTRMQAWQMRIDGIHLHPTMPTGLVRVNLCNGEPHYDIVKPAAWDLIEIRGLPAMNAMPLIYHGSLAMRHQASCHAFASLCQQSAAPLFMDVNLRDPWWQQQNVWQQLERATYVKLNAGELQRLIPDMKDEADRIEHVMALPRIQHLILTRGAGGAELWSRDGRCHSVAPAISGIAVVDTVGAGDAFASVCLLGLLKGWDIELFLQRAQLFASAIVGIRGATCENRDLYYRLRTEWNI